MKKDTKLFIAFIGVFLIAIFLIYVILTSFTSIISKEHILKKYPNSNDYTILLEELLTYENGGEIITREVIEDLLESELGLDLYEVMTRGGGDITKIMSKDSDLLKSCLLQFYNKFYFIFDKQALQDRLDYLSFLSYKVLQINILDDLMKRTKLSILEENK